MTCRTGKNFTGPWSAPSMMAFQAICSPPDAKNLSGEPERYTCIYVQTRKPEI